MIRLRRDGVAWIALLRLGVRKFLCTFLEHHIAGSVACRRLSRRVQSFEKRYKSRCLRRTQIFSIRRHVAAALDHLANELILCEPHGDAIQSRASVPAAVSKCVAV